MNCKFTVKSQVQCVISSLPLSNLWQILGFGLFHSLSWLLFLFCLGTHSLTKNGSRWCDSWLEEEAVNQVTRQAPFHPLCSAKVKTAQENKGGGAFMNKYFPVSVFTLWETRTDVLLARGEVMLLAAFYLHVRINLVDRPLYWFQF